MIVFKMEVFYSFFHHVGFEDTKGINFFIFQGFVELCFLGLVQTTHIPLKNLELVVSSPWTSQSSPGPEIQMGNYFTSRVFYSGQVHGRFIDWDVFEL
jgi:hypothetical protein